MAAADAESARRASARSRVDAREGELVAATHGRAFWILDNLALLEQLARQIRPLDCGAQIFAPETAWLTQRVRSGRRSRSATTGENPEYGAAVFFNLPPNYNGRTPATLTFLDADGRDGAELHAAPQAEEREAS